MTSKLLRCIPSGALHPRLAWAVLIEMLLMEAVPEFLAIANDVPRAWTEPLYASTHMLVSVVFPFAVARYLGAHHVFVGATVAGAATGIVALVGGMLRLSFANDPWPMFISVPLAAIASGLLAAVVGACAGAAAAMWCAKAAPETEARWHRKAVIHGPLSHRARLLLTLSYFTLAAIGSLAPASAIAGWMTADVSSFEGARGIAASLAIPSVAAACTLVTWFAYPLIRRHDHTLVIAQLPLLAMSAWSYNLFRWLL